jgi:intracellular multiplication protein IcmE
VNLPDSTKSYSISAIAIDPDTARTALATKVNYHYLLRYGSLFASSFLTGYGNAVGRTNQTTTVSPFGSTTTQSGNLTPKQEFLTALGTVGQQWGSNLAPIMSTPPTIMVSSGTSVGILILADFHPK